MQDKLQIVLNLPHSYSDLSNKLINNHHKHWSGLSALPTLISAGLGLQKPSSTSILNWAPTAELFPSSTVPPSVVSMLPYSLLFMFIGENPIICCSSEGGVGYILWRSAVPNFRSEADFRAWKLSEVLPESQNFRKVNEGYISKLPQHIRVKCLGLVFSLGKKKTQINLTYAWQWV